MPLDLAKGKLTPEEVAHRLPVWCAFADLFLDTDVSIFYPYIRRTMEASGFTRDELWHILSVEVAPAFCFNMHLVAGEWAGWGDDFVQMPVLTRLNHPPWLRKLLLAVACRCLSYSTEEWNKVLSAPAD